MKIIIKGGNHNLKLYFPLFFGGIAIRCIPKDTMTKEQKCLAIKSFNIIKKELKKCKGINIIDIKSATGEEITISI